MNRIYFNEASILSVAKTTETNARNDLKELGEFGITESTLTDFAAKIKSAEALPGESARRIELKSLTLEKESTLEACYEWGKRLRTVN